MEGEEGEGACKPEGTIMQSRRVLSNFSAKISELRLRAKANSSGPVVSRMQIH